MLRVFLLTLLFLSACSKNEQNSDTASKFSITESSVNWPSDLEEVVCQESSGANNFTLSLDSPAAGQITWWGLTNRFIYVDQYQIEGRALKVIKSVYSGESVHQMEGDYMALRLSDMKDRKAGFLTHKNSIYIVDHRSDVNSGIRDVIYYLLPESGKYSVFISHSIDGVGGFSKHENCDLILRAQDHSSASPVLGGVNVGDENCVGFIVKNYLDTALRGNKDVIDGVREDCKKPKHAVCFHKKIFDARSEMSPDDVINAATLDEWSMACE
jgi:hypothetical protein